MRGYSEEVQQGPGSVSGSPQSITGDIWEENSVSLTPPTPTPATCYTPRAHLHGPVARMTSCFFEGACVTARSARGSSDGVPSTESSRLWTSSYPERQWQALPVDTFKITITCQGAWSFEAQAALQKCCRMSSAPTFVLLKCLFIAAIEQETKRSMLEKSRRKGGLKDSPEGHEVTQAKTALWGET